MAVSWVRTEIKRRWPKTAEVEAAAVDVLTRYGKAAVVEVRRDIWHAGRFVYRGLRPRPLRSKSGEAWMFRLDLRASAAPALVLDNPAINRSGKPYARYVHLAGRRDPLINEVHDYVEQDLAPRIGEAMARAYERLALTAGTETRSKTWSA